MKTATLKAAYGKYKKPIIMLALCAAAICAVTILKPDQKENSPSSELFTKTFAAEIGSVKKSFTSDGYVELSTYDISFDRAGIVNKVNVKEGDYIESGTLIASLKSEDYESAVETQRNMLEQAKLSYQKNAQNRTQSLGSTESKLLSARHSLENAKSEYGLVTSVEGAYSQAEITQKKQALEACQEEYDIILDEYNTEKNSSVDEQLDSLSIEKAAESLKNAQDDLEKSKMYSPVSGLIVDISKKAGERITEEETFIRIASSNDLSIKTEVSELDIANVKKDMSVEITFDSSDERKYTGRVDHNSHSSILNRCDSPYSRWNRHNERAFRICT